MAEKKVKIVKQDGLNITLDGEWGGGSGPSSEYLTGATQTKSSTESGGENEVTFTKSDGTTSTLTVYNGIKGDDGDNGISAGFGTPTATVGTGTGTPSVTVTASGDNTAKVFNFAFDGLKGSPGQNATTTSVVSTSANGLAPRVTSTSGFLKGDGTWSTPTGFAVSKTLSNEDLNSVTTPGFYAAGGSNSVTNSPLSTKAFGLTVVHDASGNYYTQYYDGYSGIRFYRNCNNGTWDSWKRIFTPIYVGKTGGDSTAPSKWRHIASITPTTSLDVSNDIHVVLKVITSVAGSGVIDISNVNLQIRRAATSSYTLLTKSVNSTYAGEVAFGYSMNTTTGLVNIWVTQDYGYEVFEVYLESDPSITTKDVSSLLTVALGTAGNYAYTETGITTLIDYGPHNTVKHTNANELVPNVPSKTKTLGTGRTFTFSLASSATNVPSSSFNWTIIVTAYASSSSAWRWSQLAIPNGTTTGNMYYRNIYSTNSGTSKTYGSWVKIPTMTDLENGYLPLSGGTVTGTLGVGTNGCDIQYNSTTKSLDFTF